MKTRWLICFVCLFFILGGCSEESEDSPANTDGTAGSGGSSGETGTAGSGGSSGKTGMGGNGGNGEDTPPMIGAPEADPIAIDHATVIEALRANLTQHIDEIDDAATMIEDSGMFENVLGLFSSEDEIEDHDEPSDPHHADDHDAQDDQGHPNESWHGRMNSNKTNPGKSGQTPSQTG